ncbi:MAG: hypothetical protein ACR2FN_01165 [Chitinophagaceae bacterium]
MDEHEQTLSSEESFALITRMINKAKDDYNETGVSALMWGSLVTFCSLVAFINYWLQIQWLDYVWILTFIAVIPQIIISINEGKKKKFKTYSDDIMGGIWISFGINIFLLSYFVNVVPVQHVDSLYLIAYGIPTFATGYAKNFKPMIIGGIACWIFSIINIYIPYPYSMLLVTLAALLAWAIPGLILRRRYQNAKEQHV